MKDISLGYRFKNKPFDLRSDNGMSRAFKIIRGMFGKLPFLQLLLAAFVICSDIKSCKITLF